ncbi:MAG: hypothetical protein ACREGR_03175 [Minisyncoccia bacterium]
MRYVLLGATGDLARKKILPALAQSAANREGFELIASSRRVWSEEDFRAFALPELLSAGVERTAANQLLSHTHYVRADFERAESIAPLAAAVKGADAMHIALLPQMYMDIIERLGEAGALGDTRLLIEKPFGVDGRSAHALNELILRYVAPERVYRIDHYLGKEDVREASTVRAHTDLARVESIEAVLFEREGVVGRGAFYDSAGVVRDVVQNHLLECVANILAETDRPLPEARLAALNKLALPANLASTITQRQYHGYKDEPGVRVGSRTPTAIEFSLEYHDEARIIPVHICAGKRMAEKRAEIRLTGAREFTLTGEGAYEFLISEALADRHDHFPIYAEIARAWDLIDPVIKLLGSLPLEIY